MNETMKKLTEETRAQIISAIATKDVADLIVKTKSSKDSDSGSFKFIVSTSDVDRQGDSINQAGWDLSFYKSNPVVLWAHDYASLPIGMCTSIEVKDGKLVAEGKFAPEDANPFAQQVRKLYDLGMVNATSVGFIPKEFDRKEAGLITKSELLEFSLVPVPANAHALRLSQTQIKDLGIDMTLLKTKGMEVSIKEDVVPEAPAPAPEPTKPDEVTPEPEKKGDVQSEVDVIEARQQKWQKYMQICEVLDAFCSVYFDDSTPVEDFSKLLTETISILTQVSGGDSSAVKGAVEKLLSGKKTFESTYAILASTRNYVALGSAKLSDGDKTAAGDKSAASRSKSSEGLKEINEFVETRSLLRIADNALEKVLRNFNDAARTRG